MYRMLTVTSVVQRLLLLLLLLYTCCTANAKSSPPPRCLDFQSPFQSRDTPGFCPDYAERGCCGESGERRLMQEHDHIKSQVDQEDWDRCKDVVKNILCQKCSPHAARLFDAGTYKGKSFPALCGDYCGTFYDTCRSFLWFLDPDLAVISFLYTKKLFCKTIAKDDSDPCYPDSPSGFQREIRQAASPSPPAPCICLKEVGKRLANPLFARHAKDGTGRVFVAEQRGKVKIYNSKTEKWNRLPFLDFRLKVLSTRRPADERGFYTLAFHPNFKKNKRFFVSYFQRRKLWERSVPDELKDLGLDFRYKVKFSEMSPSRWNPNIANVFSERKVLEVLQPYHSHNSGEMFFGVDGYLYTIQGDGGWARDPYNMSQNKALPYGKVFRLDVDSDSSKPYTIPPDNPFVGEAGTKPEIYAYGTRNMWRCGVDPGDRITGESRGRVLCGDVGQYEHEEIDELKKGANYGWNSREGFACFDEDSCGNIGEEELPITTYNHTVGLSVTGGVFYRGCQSQNLNGYYIYGDFATSRLFTLLNTSGEWLNEDLSICAEKECQGDLTSNLQGKILSFGQDEDGEAYILTSKSVSSFRRNGFMYKIIDPTRESDPSECENTLYAKRRVPLPDKDAIWTRAYKILKRFGATPKSQSLIAKLMEEKNGARS